MRKLLAYKDDNKVFIREYNEEDGKWMEVEDAINFIEFRKTLNIPLPQIFTNEDCKIELTVINIKARFNNDYKFL